MPVDLAAVLGIPTAVVEKLEAELVESGVPCARPVDRPATLVAGQPACAQTEARERAVLGRLRHVDRPHRAPRADQIGGLKIAPGLTVPPSVHVMIVELATVIGHDLEITQDPITGLVTITG